jgi:hypothetical protein
LARLVIWQKAVLGLFDTEDGSDKVLRKVCHYLRGDRRAKRSKFNTKEPTIVSDKGEPCHGSGG